MNETFEDDGPFNWRKNENVEEKQKPATHFDWVEPSFATPMDEILQRMGDETSLEQMIYEDLDEERIEVFEIENLAISQRGKDWFLFAIEVLDHIEKYTVPQYGDKGTDQCSEFSPEDFLTQIRKYCNRFGKNARPGQEELDLKKAAHYVQMLLTKITEEKKNETRG